MSNYMSSASTRKSDDKYDDELTDRVDTKRKIRNASEKNRRDQFNNLINELNRMLSTTNRKMDKSTVLKTTINYLNKQKDILLKSKVHEIDNDWKPAFLLNEEFTHIILEALDGFMIVFTSLGKILHASETVTALLGYLPKTMENLSIFKIIHEADHSLLQDRIVESRLSKNYDNDQIVFSCHCKRHDPFKDKEEINEKNQFELVQFFGYFQPSSEIYHGDNHRVSSPFSSEEDDQNLVFVGIGRIMTPQLLKELPVMEDIKSEFTSRHSLEWKFLFLDHRGPSIIGYMPFEVLGTSGYEYYHIDDLEDVILSHQALMLKGEGTSCYYRFLTKGQQWIWLQSRYYISYHQWNSKPEFIVCHHQVINYFNVIKKEGETNDGRKNSKKRLWHIPLNEIEHHSSNSDYDSYQKRHYEQPSTDSPKMKIRSIEDIRNSNSEVESLALVESKHDVTETFNNYLENAQSSVKLPAGSVSPSQENLIQDQLQRKQEELQKTIVKQQEELKKITKQLLMARCGILPTFMDDSLQTSTQTSEQTTQPETSTNQIICSNTSGELFETRPLISSDVLLLHERNEQVMQHSYSSNIVQNMVDEGGGQLDYSYSNQSNDVLFEQSSP
ncbi:circadian locomoter output cycles protein kaput-like [Metopolophium dirhodum]|uniref:circadian locomoter output cycles protein kaput-like n=1 Tax=Metopolophium dirhodum TaxID=44670 RepID=UPI00298F7DBA|nr:circadian locomoter output cycles protein kaput-like [Metopolophium dirhodum]